MERNEPYELLKALLPAQFDEVVFRLNIDTSHLPPGTAPHSVRATQLVRMLEPQNGGLERLLQIIQAVAPYLVMQRGASSSVAGRPGEPVTPWTEATSTRPGPTATQSGTPAIRVFCSYASGDEHSFASFRSHFSPFERNGRIRLWARGMAVAGSDLNRQVEEELAGADILLLFVSPVYLSSETTIYETNRALQRADRNEARVIPILLRPAAWEQTPLGKLQALPRDGRAISTWRNRDEAFVDVIQALSNVLDALQKKQPSPDEFRGAGEGSEPASFGVGIEASSQHGIEGTDVFRSRHQWQDISRSASKHPNVPRSANERPAVLQGGDKGQELFRGSNDLKPDTTPTGDAARPILSIATIFRDSGVPDETFVKTEQFEDIRFELAIMGKALVVEGPSGVGKTSTTMTALGDRPHKWIHAGTSNGRAELQKVLASSTSGHLVVDDFHRLAPGLKIELAERMKSLADEARPTGKITVIGINPIGQSLVLDFPELTGRFERIYVGRQPDKNIEQLIRQGEAAANICFLLRGDFVNSSFGSFYTAQKLCLEAAKKARILDTQTTPKEIHFSPKDVENRVRSTLSPFFDPLLINLAGYDVSAPPRGATLALLWLISEATEGFISLEEARLRFPTLIPAYDWLQQGNLQGCFATYPQLARLFYYHQSMGVLSLEDPRLQYYLRTQNWTEFAKRTGHSQVAWGEFAGPIFTRETHMEPVSSRLVRKATVDILHLSDLHVADGSEANRWFNQIAEDLKRELGCVRLNALVLSGDIGNHSEVKEYEAARQFIEHLGGEFGLAPQQVVMVPGNHDLSWPRSREAYRTHRASDYKAELREGTYFREGNYLEVRDEDAYKRRFEQFAEFYFKVTGEIYPLDYAHQATLHHFQREELLFLGLNSSWKIDHHFSDRADIHPDALNLPLSRIRSNEAYDRCLKIAVWHHPLASSSDDRIRDHGFMERLANAGFRLALHGHIHKAQNGLYRYDMTAGGRQVDVISAGTFGAITKEWVPGYPLQYNLLRISDAMVTVETRKREELNGAWNPDARWKQGAGRDPKPRYDIGI